MYGTLRSSKVHEILQIIKHINYSNVSTSLSSDLLGRECLRTYFFNTAMNLSKGNILCRKTGPKIVISVTI